MASHFSWESDAQLILILTVGTGHQFCKKLLVIILVDVWLKDLFFLDYEVSSNITLSLNAIDGQGGPRRVISK